jgi:hypothetical protein
MILKYVDCGKNKRSADLAKIKECAANGWIAVLGRYNYSNNGNDIQDLIAELEGTMPSEGYKEGDILNTHWGWEQTNEGRAVYITDFIPAYRWNGLPKDYYSYA